MTTRHAAAGPLEGTVILDLTRLLPGEAAIRLFTSFGATVIPVKLPDYDLKTAAGQSALLALASRADVLIESFRPGVMASWGLGYETLCRHNPRLVYAAITGYGQQGPYASLAGHDINYLALSGILHLTGPKGGSPVLPGVQMADLAGGTMQAVIGILLALIARQATGRGQMVDASMLHGSLWLLAFPLLLRASGSPTERGNSLLTGRYACYRVYQAAGEQYVAVGALEPKFWSNLCTALGCPQFIADQFAEGERQQEIQQFLGAVFRTRTAESWFQLLKDHDTCVTPVRTLDEVAAEFGSSTPLIPRLTAAEEGP